jgi:hypothetical protein
LNAAWAGSVPVTDDVICGNSLRLWWWAVPTLQLKKTIPYPYHGSARDHRDHSLSILAL